MGNVLRELRDEYTEEPEEIHEPTGSRLRDKTYLARKEYEEETMTRLPMTKRDKKMMKSQNKGTIGNIGDELTSFGDISAFIGEEDWEDTALRNYRDSAGNKKTKRKLNRK